MRLLPLRPELDPDGWETQPEGRGFFRSKSTDTIAPIAEAALPVAGVFGKDFVVVLIVCDSDDRRLLKV